MIGNKSNRKPKRKIGSLECWRVQYGYVSGKIREVRTLVQTGGHWGQFRSTTTQSYLRALQQQARDLMEDRGDAREKAHAEWLLRDDEWKREHAQP